jgi:hypothetical protein
VSLDATIARISELQAMLAPQRPAPTPAPATSVASTLSSAGGAPATAAGAAPAAHGLLGVAPVGGGTGAGRAALAAAQAEVGVAESPPGSNDSPRIAEYRTATAGNPGPGAWCAYFVSWASRQAGAPLGDMGQGFGRVDDVWAWAQSSGRAVQQPQPGDLVVWDEHIGIVESVGADGTLTTVEGNSSDAVSRRTYGPGERPALGYVRLG